MKMFLVFVEWVAFNFIMNIITAFLSGDWAFTISYAALVMFGWNVFVINFKIKESRRTILVCLSWLISFIGLIAACVTCCALYFEPGYINRAMPLVLFIFAVVSGLYICAVCANIKKRAVK